MFQRMLACLVPYMSVVVAMGASVPALAQSQDPCGFITDPYQKLHCLSRHEFNRRNMEWYASLTPRQRRLDAAVEKITWEYRQRTGQSLPVNNSTVAEMAQALGVQNQEELAFVVQRMQAMAAADNKIRQLDGMLDYGRRQLQISQCVLAGGTPLGCMQHR